MPIPEPMETERLILRPFTLKDAKEVQRLAGIQEVSCNLCNVPYPYPDGEAERWIGTHSEQYENGDFSLAVTLKENGALIGAIGLHTKPAHERAEMGYWLGKDHWGKGYASEAAKCMVKFGFEQLHLHRIYAHYFMHNPASRKVMEKAGLKFEGVLRGEIIKDGKHIDLGVCGMTIEDYREDRLVPMD